MTGRITRIISNLYTVEVDGKTYECRARGKFKNMGLTPLVGDIVEIDEKENYILEIHERKNSMERPMIANVDCCVVVSSLKRPDFKPYLLDKMLTNVMLHDITPIVCFTKYDLLSSSEKREYRNLIKYYNSIGIKTMTNKKLGKLKKLLKNKVVVLTGQTGVGKSTLLNKIDASLNLKTDDISEALGRGKHTTRHVELFKYKNILLADTPGFSALDIDSLQKDQIRFTFPEFKNDKCKYQNCMHNHEKGCQVLEDLESGKIRKSRYESYRKMVEE